MANLPLIPVWIEIELAATMYADDRVDGEGRLLYLDKVDSVSGARRDEPHHVWDDRLLDEQHRRFLNDFDLEVFDVDEAMG